jgi:hypothetical protein
MDQGRTAKKIFVSKSEGRKRGRLRWLEDVKKDRREMKVKEMSTGDSG